MFTKVFAMFHLYNGTLLSDMNTYDIVNADTVVFTESAAKIFVEENEEEISEMKSIIKIVI